MTYFEGRAMRKVVLAIAMMACGHAALAQSNPNLTYGQVPTAAQWNSYFSAKQDVLGFTALNASGGTMSGPLFLFPASATVTGLNVGVGIAPNFPNNGDMWMTSLGLFARINGSTVNISTGGALPIALPATVSGTVNSGAIPFFSSSTTMASSATLGAGLLVKGGGAGVAPATFTLGGGCTFATPNLTCAASALTGTTLAANVVASSLTSVGALVGGSTAAGFTINLATSTVSGILPTANTAALTGDVTKPSGSSVTSSVLTGDVTKSAGSTATTTSLLQGTAFTGTTGTGAAVLGNQPTINQPVVIGDTSAATNPTAGSVGETLSVSGSAVSVVSNTPKTITSQSVTAGHWTCTVGGITNPATTTTTSIAGFSVSLTNNTTGASPGFFIVQGVSAGANAAIGANAGPVRYDFTSPTTVYGISQVVFATSTMTVSETLSCQRIF